MHPISTTSSSISTPVTLFLADFEVDGLTLTNRETGAEEVPNITQGCLKVFRGDEKTDYLITYSKKPEHIAYEGPYNRKIPQGSKALPIKTCLEKMRSFIRKQTLGDLALILVYNKNWDEPLLKGNCKRWGVDHKWSWHKIHFLDAAEIARHLGFAKGTTLSLFASAYKEHFSEPMPHNRHTSHADTRVLTLVMRHLFKKVWQEHRDAFFAALRREQRELAVAELLKASDPTLLEPIAATNEKVKLLREEKIAQRKGFLVMGVDLETTGLESREIQHHEKPIRALQFAAILLQPNGSFDPLDKFSKLVNPGPHTEIQEGALRTHGITKDKTDDAPPMVAVWEEFMEFIHHSKALKATFDAYKSNHPDAETSSLEAFKYTSILFGYNFNSYDKPILEQELIKGDIDLKQAIAHGSYRTFDWFPIIQTLFSGQGRRLVDLARTYGIRCEGAHDAIKDVAILIQVARKICEPLDLTATIIHLSSIQEHPGIAGKEIILRAKKLMAEGQTCEEALQEATSLYLDKVRIETAVLSETGTKKRGKKRKIEEEKEDDDVSTQELLTESYPYTASQEDLPLIYR